MFQLIGVVAVMIFLLNKAYPDHLKMWQRTSAYYL